MKKGSLCLLCLGLTLVAGASAAAEPGSSGLSRQNPGFGRAGSWLFAVEGSVASTGGEVVFGRDSSDLPDVFSIGLHPLLGYFILDGFVLAARVGYDSTHQEDQSEESSSSTTVVQLSPGYVLHIMEDLYLLGFARVGMLYADGESKSKQSEYPHESGTENLGVVYGVSAGGAMTVGVSRGGWIALLGTWSGASLSTTQHSFQGDIDCTNHADTTTSSFSLDLNVGVFF